MAHYRKKTSYQSNRRQSGSFAWIWLLAGVALGIFSVVYTYPLFQQGFSSDTVKRFILSKIYTEPRLEASHTLEQKVIIKKKPPEAQQYEFYTMLPDMEVSLPKEDVRLTVQPQPISKTTNETKTTIAQVSKPVKPVNNSEQPVMIIRSPQSISKIPNKKINKQSVEIKQTKLVQYLIQAGMYRTVKVADSLKARLALLGVNTRIQKIKAEDGLWFRVIVGPFVDEALALAEQKRLATQKIKGILVKQRKLK